MPTKYIDIEKHWPKIKPHAESETATYIWRRDLEKFYIEFMLFGPDLDWDEFDENWFNEVNRPFNPSTPADLDGCDWRCEEEREPPEFWEYVVHSNCHWLVNFNLYCAQKTFPKSQWRIITSNEHSCVWDGEDTLFDMNFLALVPDIRDHPFYGKIPANARVLPVGKELSLPIKDAHIKTVKDYIQGNITFEMFHAVFFE